MNRVMKKISGISTKTKLTFVIIMLSLSLTSMIAMKYFTAVEIPEEEVLKPVLPDSGGNLELDPHFIKVTQIREDVRNVLFVIDSSEKEGIEPAGYYILSIDLSKNLIRVVSVEKDLIIHTKNDKDLMLSEVTSTFGVESGTGTGYEKLSGAGLSEPVMGSELIKFGQNEKRSYGRVHSI
jgi:hypothetical protein